MSQENNLNPAAVRRVLKELSDLAKNPIDGITVIANEDDVTEIQAVIDGPEDTPFSAGTFKIKLKLGSDFPQAPPKGLFATKIFHPNVSKAGEICVNTLKKDWTENMGIKHILVTIRCLMIEPNPASALNEEAGRLLLEDYEDYYSRATLMTSIHATKKKEKKFEEEEKEVDENQDINSNIATPSNSGLKAAPKKATAKKAATKKQIAKKRSLKRL